jgi:non-ribosomal peptide synthetase component F
VLERQVGYWRERLAGLEAGSEPPADRSRPPVQSFRGARELASLSPEVTEALGRLGRERGATLFMVLLAGFYALLHRSGAGDDLAVGSPIANRTRAETEGLIGFFVNTLVLRATVRGEGGEPGGLAWRELLGGVRSRTLSAFAHQELPFERLVDRLEPRRDLSRPPLFQAMFVLQNAPLDRIDLPDLELRPLPMATGLSRFDLTLTLTETEAGLEGSLEYGADLFDEPTMARLLGHFGNLLESALAEPERAVGELELLGEAERRQVLEGWNRPAVALPADRAVPGRIVERARRTPDAPAVVSGAGTASYRDLDRLSAALARRLRGSGAAYVPLDPSHPRERLG